MEIKINIMIKIIYYIYIIINMPKKKSMNNMNQKQHDMFSQAVKDGVLTKKQHDKLPPKLLEAIIKKKMKK
jgi:hypothetical protein